MDTTVTRRRDTAEDRSAQRTAFATALTHILELKGMTHRDLTEQLGSSHTVVTGWKNTDHEPAPWTVFDVERALELPPGYLSTHLGYLPNEARTAAIPSETVEAAIKGDPNLDDRARRLLKTMYLELRMPQPRRRRA